MFDKVAPEAGHIVEVLIDFHEAGGDKRGIGDGGNAPIPFQIAFRKSGPGQWAEQSEVPLRRQDTSWCRLNGTDEMSGYEIRNHSVM